MAYWSVNYNVYNSLVEDRVIEYSFDCFCGKFVHLQENKGIITLFLGKLY